MSHIDITLEDGRRIEVSHEATMPPLPPRERLLEQWITLCHELHNPDLELTVEEFSAVLSVYRGLCGEGVQFEPMLVAIFAVLERQASETFDGLEDDTDSDEDGSDISSDNG